MEHLLEGRADQGCLAGDEDVADEGQLRQRSVVVSEAPRLACIGLEIDDGTNGDHDLAPGQAPTMDLNTCFTQRATNRAVGLGSAIQIPIGLTNVGTGILPPSVALTLVLDDTSDKSLRSLGLDSFGRSDFYIPLTAEMLSPSQSGAAIGASSVWYQCVDDVLPRHASAFPR